MNAHELKHQMEQNIKNFIETELTAYQKSTGLDVNKVDVSFIETTGVGSERKQYIILDVRCGIY